MCRFCRLWATLNSHTLADMPLHRRRSSLLISLLLVAFSVTALSAAPATSAPSQRRAGLRAATPAEIARAGLRPGTGSCAGSYEDASQPEGTRGKTCSHGPDIMEEQTVAAGADDPSVYAAGSPTPSNGQIGTTIPCYSTGPFVRVMYVYDSVNRLDAASPGARRPLIREVIALTDRLFYNAAKATDGYRRVRWRMTSACNLSIKAIKMSTAMGPTQMRQALISGGHMSSSEKGLVFLEQQSCSGVAELFDDKTRSSTNRNNQGAMLAQASVFFCLNAQSTVADGGLIAAHELLHTLGAVQDYAPYSTEAGHCWDETDVMCYADGSGDAMRQRCPVVSPEPIDCGKDTYFDVTPSSTEWLAKYWNTASNRFLARTSTSKTDKLDRPTLSITSPTNGATVGGAMKISVTAAAPSGSTVNRVEFFIDGTKVGTDTTSPYSYTVDTRWDGVTGYRNRTALDITAYVVDSYNRSKKSSLVEVTVDSPTVRLLTPTPQTAVGASGSWSAAAGAGAGRTVTKVELLVNGTLASTDMTAPYGGTFSPPVSAASGDAVTVAARVTDSGGSTRTTPARSVTVRRSTIEWVSPTYGYENVTGPSMLAVAVEGSDVTGVEFFVDNVSIGTDATTPYSMLWSGSATPGDHIARAVVHHSIGPDVVSYDATLALAPSPDSASITTPSNDAALSGSTTITAEATGTPDSVSIQVDGNEVASLYSAPYTTTIDASTLSPGTHIVRAVASYWSYDEITDTYDSWTATSAGTVVTTAPTLGTVAFSSPSSDATVSGATVPFGLSVSLASGWAVNSMDYFINERNQGWDYEAPWTGSFDSTTLPDGTYTLRAVATLYNTTSSARATVTATRSVNIANLAVTLVEPHAGENVFGTKVLTATVRLDPEARVEWVRFYVDNVYVGRDGTAPYAYSWASTTVANGSHTFKAVATTSDGRTPYASRAVTVSN